MLRINPTWIVENDRMKRIKFFGSLLMTVAFLASFTVSGAAAKLTIKTKNGQVYTCVNTKEEYAQMVQYAIDNHLEHVNVCYQTDKQQWDSSYSNNVLNFTHYDTKTQFDDFKDYNTNTVCVTPTMMDSLTEDGSVQEHWGTIDLTFNDTKEELAKADVEIRQILSAVSSKSQAEQIRYAAEYICKKAQYGSQELPGGGYDSINGVYDVLNEVRTNTVCTSYAVTMMRFLDLMGLENVLLSNYQTVHVWNMVELDGQWYGIDCTFEDSNPGSYVLMGQDMLKSYDSSNFPTVATFAKTHKIAAKAYGKGTDGSKKTNFPQSNTPPSSKPSRSEQTSSQPTSSPVTSSQEGTASAPEQTAFQVNLTQTPVVPAEVFAQAVQDGKDLVLIGEKYRWKFSGVNLKSDTVGELNGTISFGDQVPQAERKQIQEAAGDRSVYPFAFAHHGTLPAPAEISIQLTEKYANNQVYVYYLNEENQPIEAATELVAQDGTLTFCTDHCSLWFISDQAIFMGGQSASSFPVWGWILVGAGVLLLSAGVGAVLLILKKRSVCHTTI